VSWLFQGLTVRANRKNGIAHLSWMRKEKPCWKKERCFCGSNGPLAFVEMWSLRKAARSGPSYGEVRVSEFYNPVQLVSLYQSWVESMCPIKNERDVRSLLNRHMRVTTASRLLTIVVTITITVVPVFYSPEAFNYWIHWGLRKVQRTC
jgi:hypothetical protein